MVAHGETPVMSLRLDPAVVERLDRLAAWLHDTRGFPKSRGVAVEYLAEFFYDQQGDLIDKA